MLIMKETTFYYVLTSLVQAEASIILLFIAIVFFVLHTLENKIKNALNYYVNSSPLSAHKSELGNLILLKKYSEANNYAMLSHPLQIQINHWIMDYEHFKKMIFFSIALAFFTITFAIIGLAFADLLSIDWIKIIIVLLTVAIFLVSTYVCLAGIKRIFRNL
jgi:hypothetical protein